MASAILNNLLSPPPQITPPQATPLVPNSTTPSVSLGISFGDILDAINPLQHIPVVSGIYRAATGNSISVGAQVVGDTLYGGAFGLGSAALSLGSSLADVAVKQTTGEDISQHVVATLGAVGNIGSQSVAPTSASPLVPASGVLPSTNSALSASQTANPSPLFVNDAQHARVNAQYQRAAALDALHKHLMKM